MEVHDMNSEKRYNKIRGCTVVHKMVNSIRLND